MVGNFLNLDDDIKPIGSGLKKKPKTIAPTIDKEAIAASGAQHGFDRTTKKASEMITPKREEPRRGRPPINEEMTYWRIYVSPSLRVDLNKLRDKEGRRLNDLLADMLEAYKMQNKT